MNEEIDNDTQLTAALFGELSPEAAEAIAAAQPEALAEMQAVVDALQADLPVEVAPLSDERRKSVLAVAAELDAALAIVPAAEPPLVIETNWFRQQLPMMVAALLMVGAGVASFVLLRQPPLDEVANMRADGPPPPGAEMAGETEMAVLAEADDSDLLLESDDIETVSVADVGAGEAGVAVTAAAPAPAAPATVAAPFPEEPMPEPAVEEVAVAVAAPAPAAPPVAMLEVLKPTVENVAVADDLADLDAVAEEAPEAFTEAPLQKSPGQGLPKPKRRMEVVAEARKAKKDVRQSGTLALESQAADAGASVAFAASARGAPSADLAAGPFAADAIADSVADVPLAANAVAPASAAPRARTKPPEKLMAQALRAQAVQAEHAPSPVHPDRLLLVINGDPTLRFDETLVQAHRKLAPGVYEVTLRPDAKRGAFASVVIDNVIVPVAIEAGKAAFDQASVSYRMAVLKALNIAAPAAAGGAPAND